MFRSRRPVKAMRRVLSFSRWGSNATIPIYDGVGTGTNSQNWNFKFNEITNFAEFTNLFNDYKLNCVIIKFFWHENAATVEDGSTAYATPVFHSIVDDNDSAMATISEMQQCASYKVWHMTKASTHTVKVYPKPLQATYRTALTTAYSPRKGFIDCTYPDVPHYGFKFAIDGSQGAIAGVGENIIGSLSWQIKYLFQMRSIN